MLAKVDGFPGDRFIPRITKPSDDSGTPVRTFLCRICTGHSPELFELCPVVPNLNRSTAKDKARPLHFVPRQHRAWLWYGGSAAIGRTA